MQNAELGVRFKRFSQGGKSTRSPSRASRPTSQISKGSDETMNDRVNRIIDSPDQSRKRRHNLVSAHDRPDNGSLA